MDKLKEALQRVTDRLTGRKTDLAKSRRRAKVWREHAEAQHDKQVRAEKHGHARRADAFKKRAERSHVKAIYWKGRVRRDDDAIPKLEAIEGKLERELAAWIKEHGVTFEGHNKVRGGTYEQRAHAAMVKAMANYRAGDQPGYYSMSGGSRDYAHALYHYASGRIWDCSTYADGTCFVTGDPSPSGPDGFRVGGYTGTELEHSRRVTGKVKCGDLVVYLRYAGDTVGHHVERVLDPDAKTTSGHGDEAINIGCNGSWDLFGDSLYVIVRPPRRSVKS
jgi:hypothetical protein